ncbi:hypothetical protein EY643_05235 [Halioglobus maricola]|uniref:Uncharacterized protein n=1 Tax=Halioglobus maricola TaxID=2601894 RepID=A0A5P9NJF3_9GAMM|nr:hypothetical protein [Halioglobus maricola]QFU75098.1 hypothetical protein EY643_05235 [Halioglobus maricola]
MASIDSQRIFTLVQRELQEFRVSMIITPLAIAGVLSVLMLASVLLAGRITAMGDEVFNILLSADEGVSPVITINLDDDDDRHSGHVDHVEIMASEVTADDPNSGEEWNFSREWRFESGAEDDQVDWDVDEVGSLNPALNVVHGLMLIVLIVITVSYLLCCLYNDRKDRTILFWKSMPVSEWEEVLVRMGMALLLVPAIYIAVSLLLQMVFVLLAMLLVWQMDKDPFDAVLGNIEFGSLLVQQLGGWLLTALWVAPVYAYLMLASAFAKRSPFLTAVAPVIALIFIEGLLLGTDYVGTAVKNHVPHYIGGESVVGFYFHSGFWNQINYLSLFAGLAFAVAAVVGSVYLRRYRFEI